MVVNIERGKVKQLINQMRSMVITFLALSLFMILIPWGFSQGDPDFFLSPAWIIFVFMAIYPTLFVIMFGLYMRQQIKMLRTDHHLQINPEDIVLRYGHQQIAIPWSDIVAVKKGMFQNRSITIKLDPESQYDRRVYHLQPVYEVDQKRLYDEIKAAWQHGRDKLKI